MADRLFYVSTSKPSARSFVELMSTFCLCAHVCIGGRRRCWWEARGCREAAEGGHAARRRPLQRTPCAARSRRVLARSTSAVFYSSRSTRTVLSRKAHGTESRQSVDVYLFVRTCLSRSTRGIATSTSGHGCVQTSNPRDSYVTASTGDRETKSLQSAPTF
jgi:hypothetical protein